MKGSRRNTGNFCRKSYYYSPAVRGKGAQGLFGVWDLPNGKETEGYAHLEECVRHNSDYMKERLKEFPGACNDPRDAMAVMYHNAQLFLETKEISDAQGRQNAIRETYEEVCRFMRYYHGLAKKTERNG